MKRFELLLAMVMVSLMFVNGGWAGPKHYVASYGSDANLCTLASPCRSFSHAVDVTDPGGEVIVLDTGGYGSVTITKSISIIAPVGMYASVTVASGTSGITINAGASDQVLIQGLTIKGISGNLNGIRAYTVGTLIVDNCFISGSESDGIYGIYFQAPDSKLVILNSTITKNSSSGVLVSNSSGSVSVSMENVTMVNNRVGLSIHPTGTGNVSATVTNSMAKHNLAGFYNVKYDTTSGPSILNLESCIAAGNIYGILSENNSDADITRLSNCTVTGNTYGVYRDLGTSGTIYSQKNNMVEDNATNSNVTPTPFSVW